MSVRNLAWVGWGGVGWGGMGWDEVGDLNWNFQVFRAEYKWFIF